MIHHHLHPRSHRCSSMHPFPAPASSAMFCFAIMVLLTLPAATVDAGNTTASPFCEPAKCGNLTIGYPFWLTGKHPPECGYRAFQVTCDHGKSSLKNGLWTYQIQHIFYHNSSFMVTNKELSEGRCDIESFVNASSDLGLTPFKISPVNRELFFLFNCTQTRQIPRSWASVRCADNETHTQFAWLAGDQYKPDDSLGPLPGNCTVSRMPVLGYGGATARDYARLIKGGFLLEYTQGPGDCEPCSETGGWCRVNVTTDLPDCHCSDGVSPAFTCGSKGNRRTIGIALGAGGGILAIIIFSFVWHKHKKRKQSRDLKDLMRSTSSMQSYSKDLELGGSPHIFTYEELEKATDGFSASRELGDGGFGTVYKGKLQDGRVVAVKRLYKNNYRRVEQFVNEVDILSRLLHQNLVTLYGCTSRSSHDLLLVYEFIPNGTVADHLHGPRAAERGLTWPARMTIAIETAEALAYLHAVEIIHRDVKTNNILLDNSFHVKVADFGLSRLFPLEVTHVSTVPQGTPGYVDPVYHQCYKLTDKSDVYSFGVVLVELISSKPAVDMSRSHSDINLASMALNRIQNHEVDQLVDPELGYETDSETKRMIDLVAELAFQCLQLDRDNRPPIKEVVAVLHCIKNGECPAKMMNKDASPKEDSHLLKDNLQYSPDSVIHRFHSQSTNHSVASNSSG
ncbi:LEAF RUST 10 DISEASE-RESISTANCE LOCUS RECEPTOR-LIKE PROTEIN KINASE-like 1.2 isoform X1 [Oryza brachyantha]|uniref:LEAF RUST 10 DISEASE-RESISTANCE LOCUS RECEPTOR-LIKE PROTEIN KINASE-like 1.2 isoform X1 n=1 Tax=Oryza brachyantha TaxID=4533 RepID=UPI00077608A2|nr:LEAF RUST 10 DISEASE-RESISTANCE LOCUS RECEPTOR-LIKE PROTEIN KINASE-like 1.2 isoform X1 [Oryza brachyantha]